MLMDPMMLSMVNPQSPPTADSALARALMNQPVQAQPMNAASPGMSIQSLMGLKNMMQPQTQQPPQQPPQGDSGGPVGYSDVLGQQGPSMWSQIASMFQGMGK